MPNPSRPITHRGWHLNLCTVRQLELARGQGRDLLARHVRVQLQGVVRGRRQGEGGRGSKGCRGLWRLTDWHVRSSRGRRGRLVVQQRELCLKCRCLGNVGMWGTNARAVPQPLWKGCG